VRGAVFQKRTTNIYAMLEEFASNILMEFMLMIGIVHITLGILRYVNRNIAGIGWIAFMFGGYLYFPGMLNATSIVNFTGLVSKPMASAIGLQLLYGGIGFAVLAALIQKRLRGLGEIANMVGVFSDVLSYLRLYALSLASTIMATTFNTEGSALGLVAGAVVILGGHVVNIALAFQGGVIHGLRLNFLEWYHYCFDGGGRLFNPLHKLKIK
jgi:V/A-type H+-transporting ATPase subunit I